MNTTFAAALTPFAFMLASYLMTAAGTAKKHLVWKGQICPVCHRERRSCTCHWL